MKNFDPKDGVSNAEQFATILEEFKEGRRRISQEAKTFSENLAELARENPAMPLFKAFELLTVKLIVLKNFLRMHRSNFRSDVHLLSTVTHKVQLTSDKVCQPHCTPANLQVVQLSTHSKATRLNCYVNLSMQVLDMVLQLWLVTLKLLNGLLITTQPVTKQLNCRS